MATQYDSLCSVKLNIQLDRAVRNKGTQLSKIDVEVHPLFILIALDTKNKRFIEYLQTDFIKWMLV
jgi:hypothetical protein